MKLQITVCRYLFFPILFCNNSWNEENNLRKKENDCMNFWKWSALTKNLHSLYLVGNGKEGHSDLVKHDIDKQDLIFNQCI